MPPTTISSESHWKLNTAAITALVVSILSVGMSWAGKADKGEVNDVRNQVFELRENRARDVTIQENILELLKRMDGRMETLDKKQDATLFEIIKQRDPGNFQLPAAPTNR